MSEDSAKYRTRVAGRFGLCLRLPLWATIAASVAGSLGCAGRMGRVLPFRREPPPTVQELVEPLRERVPPVETLWLRARVTVWRRWRPGKLHFEATLLADVPERLRLRAYRNRTIRVFDVLVDSSEWRVHNVLENRYYKGDLDSLRRSDLRWLHLARTLLLEGLLVEPTVLHRLESAWTTRVRRRWRGVELTLAGPEGQTKVRFDQAGGPIIALESRPSRSVAPTRLEYEDPLMIKGLRLPRRVEMDHRTSRLRLRLELLDDSAPRVNLPGGFDPRVFQLEPPGGRGWLPLSRIGR